jgi:hypothetical protein
VGGRHHGDNAPIALGECHPFAKPGQERFVRWSRRFEFTCPLCQCVQIRTQQRFEQGFSRREMTKQRGRPDFCPAGDISHRRIGAMLGDDLTRDREKMAVIFFASARIGAQEIAKGAPAGAHVVKAFNTIFGHVLARGGRLDAFIAADDAEAKARVSTFIESLGLRPFDVGGLHMAQTIEALGLMMIGLAKNGAGTWDIALNVDIG